jgi:ATP-binding cassette subfamily C (CFTR/MRP) protein 10
MHLGSGNEQTVSVSTAERSCFSSGEIQTLMSVDGDRVVNLCASVHELWSLPLQMAVALGLLYMQVKFAFLAGLAVIILLIPGGWVCSPSLSAGQSVPVMGFGFLRFSCMREGPGLFHE